MQKKLVTAAIASAFALGGTAAYAELADTGNVLISPFYGAADYGESANETYLSVVNTTGDTKAVKVRFREGRGSEDSLDFHVYLSPYDVWTAAITQNSDGQTVLVSSDNSCTVPAMTADPDSSLALFLPTYIPEDYEGDENGDLPTAQERVSEGYFEILEMATFTGSTESSTTLAGNVKHQANGEPLDCSVAVALNNASNLLASPEPGPYAIAGTDVTANFAPPSGGLFGNSAVINVINGTYKPFEMTALDTLEAIGDGTLFFSQNRATSDELLAYTADNGLKNAKNDQIQYWDLPDLSSDSLGVLSDATPIESVHLAAVNNALLTQSIMNEYVIDENIGASTDWVVTFPTKKFHATDGFLGENADGDIVHGVEDDEAEGEPYAPKEPFTVVFNESLGQACEPVNFRIFDREEQEEVPDTPTGIGFSPGLPTTPDVTSLCFEMNVVSINDADTAEDLQMPSSVMGGTTTRQNINIEELDGDAGWMILDLTEGNDSDLKSSHGLPAIGFMAADFINEGVVDGGALRNYGGTWNHRYERNPELGIEPVRPE